MTTAVLPEPLRRAVSPYTGIVRSLEECLHLPTEPPLFRYSCEVGRGDDIIGVPLDHLGGIGGAGLTRPDAAAAAVGEALERYSTTYAPRERIVVATARELGDDAVAPERFALFSPRQYASDGFPFRPFDRDTRVPWIDGWRVRDRRRAWLPAELVLLGHVSDGAARIGYATSNGAACAPSVDDAIVRGLCELLERDAFMIVWSNRLSLPLLRWSGDTGLAELDDLYFAVTGLEYATVDLSPFHRLPSVLAVVRAPRGLRGAVGVGAGTAPTIARAWWKALSEAFACRSAGAKLELLAERAPVEHVGTFEDHIRFYADHDRARAAAFLTASSDRVDTRDVAELDGATAAEHAHELAARVDDAGSTAYAVDVTSPDVAELGLHVVKTVAPELCPLDVPHGARFLGGRRLYYGAARAGLTMRVPTEAGLNPDPHPFP